MRASPRCSWSHCLVTDEARGHSSRPLVALCTFLLTRMIRRQCRHRRCRCRLPYRCRRRRRNSSSSSKQAHRHRLRPNGSAPAWPCGPLCGSPATSNRRATARLPVATCAYWPSATTPRYGARAACGRSAPLQRRRLRRRDSSRPRASARAAAISCCSATRWAACSQSKCSWGPAPGHGRLSRLWTRGRGIGAALAQVLETRWARRARALVRALARLRTRAMMRPPWHVLRAQLSSSARRTAARPSRSGPCAS